MLKCSPQKVKLSSSLEIHEVGHEINRRTHGKYVPRSRIFSLFASKKMRSSFMRSTRTCLMSSPMYMPEIIFSKICLPGLTDISSTARSHLVTTKSSSPLSPNAPHSVLMTCRDKDMSCLQCGLLVPNYLVVK